MPPCTLVSMRCASFAGNLTSRSSEHEPVCLRVPLCNDPATANVTSTQIEYALLCCVGGSLAHDCSRSRVSEVARRQNDGAPNSRTPTEEYIIRASARAQ